MSNKQRKNSGEKKTANKRAHKLLSTRYLVVAVAQRKTAADLLWLIAAIAMKHSVVEKKKTGTNQLELIIGACALKSNVRQIMLYKTHTHTWLIAGSFYFCRQFLWLMLVLNWTPSHICPRWLFFKISFINCWAVWVCFFFFNKMHFVWFVVATVAVA